METASGLYLARFQSDSTDNLLARKHVTQVRILKRAAHTLIVMVTVGAALMTFEPVRQYGVSLFASAGVAGLVVGLAARPVLTNLLAGIQIATTQPIRIDDQVVVENENGRIEEITSTYVVIRLWDLRRLIVPLSYFIEKPFQNWTRDSTNLIGTVLLHVDFTAPIERIRAKAMEIVQGSKLWDGQMVKLQVTDAKEDDRAAGARSARSHGDAFDLRCEVREKLRLLAAGASDGVAAHATGSRSPQPAGRGRRPSGANSGAVTTQTFRSIPAIADDRLARLCLRLRAPFTRQPIGNENTMTPSRPCQAAVAGVLAAAPLAALAQALPTPAWPERTIQAIVPFAAGAANDIVGRIVLEQVSKQIGQPIVIENRPGAGGTLGVNAVAKAAPNGHTILVTHDRQLRLLAAQEPALRHAQ